MKLLDFRTNSNNLMRLEFLGVEFTHFDKIFLIQLISSSCGKLVYKLVTSMLNIQLLVDNSKPCTLERKSPVSLMLLLVLRTKGCRIISSNVDIFSVGLLTLETIGLPGGGGVETYFSELSIINFMKYQFYRRKRPSAKTF